VVEEELRWKLIIAKNPKQIAANASVSDYLFVFFSYSSLK